MFDIQKDFLSVKDLDNLIFNLKDLIIIELILSYLPIVKFKKINNFNLSYLFYDKKIDKKWIKLNKKKFYFPITIFNFFNSIPDILYEKQDFVVSDNHDSSNIIIDNNIANIEPKKINFYRENNSKYLFLLDIHFLELFQKMDITQKLKIDFKNFKVLNNNFFKKFMNKFGSSSDYNYYDEDVLKLYLEIDNYMDENYDNNDVTDNYLEPDISYCNRTIHKPFDCGCNYCLRCYFRSTLYEDSFLNSLDKGSSIDVTIFNIFFEEDLSYDLLKKIFIRNKKELHYIKNILF